MGTRSFIGIEGENGKIKSIFCRLNGFVSHNGKILHSNYNSEYFVQKLINMGDIHYLEENLKSVVSDFDPKKNGINRNKWCNCKPLTHKDQNSYIKYAKSSMAAYLYLFTNNEWMVMGTCEENSDKFERVSDVLKKEKDNDKSIEL